MSSCGAAYSPAVLASKKRQRAIYCTDLCVGGIEPTYQSPYGASDFFYTTMQRIYLELEYIAQFHSSGFRD